MRSILRFRLRTLLMMLTIFGISIGLWVRPARQQRQAVEYLSKLNAYIGYNHDSEDLWTPDFVRNIVGNDFFVSVDFVALSAGVDTENLPEVIGHLRRLPLLKGLTLELDFLELAETDLGRFEQLTQLSYLELWADLPAHVTDGLRQLASMDQLLELGLYGAAFTNESLQILSKFDGLRYVTVYGSKTVDDEGLRLLIDCPGLQKLYLGALPHVEKSLPELARMESLKHLVISDMHLLKAINTESVEEPTSQPPNGPFVLSDDYDEDVQEPGDTEDWQRLKSWLESLNPGLKVEVFDSGRQIL